jgi:hypothetical protein
MASRVDFTEDKGWDYARSSSFSSTSREKELRERVCCIVMTLGALGYFHFHGPGLACFPLTPWHLGVGSICGLGCDYRANQFTASSWGCNRGEPQTPLEDQEGSSPSSRGRQETHELSSTGVSVNRSNGRGGGYANDDHDGDILILQQQPKTTTKSQRQPPRANVA